MTTISIESNDYLQLVEDFPDGILVIDSQGVAKFANQTAIRLFGGQAEAILEQSLGLPLDREHVCELDVVTDPAHPIIAEMRLSKTKWQGEDAYVASLRDVTTKREEQEIVETVFQAFAVLQEGFFICNESGQIIYANPAFEKITGYRLKEIYGKKPAFLKSGLHDDEFYDHFYRKLSVEGEWDGVIWNKRANGDVFPENLHVSVIHKNNGRVKYYVAIFSDYTDSFRKSVELQRLKEEAILSEKTKSNFLSKASHEIRAPMSGIIGYSELLAETNLSTEQREYLEVIRSSARSLLNMINEVLDISRMQAGRGQTLSVFSIRDLIQELYQFFKVHTLKKDIVLGHYFSASIPDWLEGEKEPLRQIFTNLLSNAFKFTRYGRISFGVDRVEDMGSRIKIYFTVSDTGIGIEKSQVSKIFDPFFQVENIMQDEYATSSSGLGLTIVKSIVEKNGGQITVESKPGEGTRFQFSFIAEKTDKKGEVAEIIEENTKRLERWKNRGRSLSVLLVEDNYPNQMYIKRILEKKSIFVTVASNGEQALDRVQSKDFDIVLMDVRMPKMDGWEATRRIRQLSDPTKSSLPIIALTGLSSEEERQCCEEAGMNGFLMKPIETEVLIHQILKFVFP